MKIKRTIAGAVLFLFLSATAVPVASAQDTRQGDVTARVVPLLASGIFIVLAVWAGIEAWNPDERKELSTGWEERRLPEEVWVLPQSASLPSEHAPETP